MNLLQMDMNLLKVLYVLLETSSTGKRRKSWLYRLLR